MSQIRYYGGNRQNNSYSENYRDDGYAPPRQSYQPSGQNFSENRNSWSDQYGRPDHVTNYSQNRYDNRSSHQQQPYSQSPPNSSNRWLQSYDDSYQSYNEAPVRGDRPYEKDQRSSRERNDYNQRNDELSLHQNNMEYGQRNRVQDTQQRIEQMHLNEQYRQPALEYQENHHYYDPPNTGNQPQMQQNGYQDPQQQPQEYQMDHFERNDIRRDNQMLHNQRPPHQPVNTYSEPSNMLQLGRPQVVAKTVNNNDAVAVFGVVAKVQKSPTHRSPPATMTSQSAYPQHQLQSEPKPFGPPQGSPTRTQHHLTPIMEQPSPPSSPYSSSKQDPRYFDSRGQRYSDAPIHSRYPQKPHPLKPRPDSSSYQPTTIHDGHRDGYRIDEQTDSSGYGSTMTERSYDGPQRQYAANQRRPPAESRSPDGQHTMIPPWQQEQQQHPNVSYESKRQAPYQRNDWESRERSYNGPDNRHYEPQGQESKPSRHWTMKKSGQADNYVRPGFQHQSHGNSGVDSSQTRGVQAVKKMFDQPRSGIPLPPTSSSYGANKYNNARPIPPRPQTYSDERYSQQQQRSPDNRSYSGSSYSFQQSSSYQPQPPDPAQIPPAVQQPRHPDQRQEKYDRYEQPRSRYSPQSTEPLHQGYSRPPDNYKSSDLPPQRPQANQRYDNRSYRDPLPHYEPPPQHSQSMGNLDTLSPRGSTALVEPPVRSRNSYSNIVPDSSMVVGVNFHTTEPSNYQRDRTHHSIPPRPASPQQHNRRRTESDPTYEDNRQPRPHHLPEQRDQPTQPYSQSSPHYQHKQFERLREEARSPESDTNYVPQVVAQSYAKFSQRSVSDVRDPPNQSRYAVQYDETENQPPRNRQEQTSLPQHPAHRKTHDQDYPPDASKTYSSFNQQTRPSQQQREEEWPEPPNIVNEVVTGTSYSAQQYKDKRFSDPPQRRQQPQQVSSDMAPQARKYPPEHNQESALSQKPQRREPEDRPYPQVPRHPFDPVDDDDSSEGIDVDAPTPPPTSRDAAIMQQRRLGAGNGPARTYDERMPDGQRGNPARERHQQQQRQLSENSSDGQYPGNQASRSHNPQERSRPLAPQKPVRSSLKHTKNAQPQKESVLPSDWDKDNTQPLNHNLSKEKSRLAKAGRLSRKPPSRSSSTANLLADAGENSSSSYEIDVTASDLNQSRSSPAKELPPSDSKTSEKSGHSKLVVHSSKSVCEATQTDRSGRAPKTDQQNKLYFTIPNEDPVQHMDTYPLPDVQEPANQEKRRPPTYTGYGNTPKPKTSLTSDLLQKFTSSREDAMKSAAKKQAGALRTLQAISKLTKRSTSPVKSPTKSSNEIRASKNVDLVKAGAKRDENRNFYNQNKPKQHRESPSERRHDSSGSDRHEIRRDRESSRKDRARSRPRSKEREHSPGRRGRSRSRDRGESPHRRGRSRSRDRIASPDRRGRSRSRDRYVSPDRRGRDRSRERDLNRDSRARKSERSRPVSPYRHRGREDDPYHRRDDDPYHRSDEPDWVKQHRRNRGSEDPSSKRRAWVNDPRWRQKKEFDINQYERDVRKATSYNSDFEQPQRKQMLPAKLMANRPPPNRRPPPGNTDWMRNLKEHNKMASRNRR